jgi:MOSC domain-containing protein YiiM
VEPVRLVAVNVGRPAPLAERVTSAIDKRRVAPGTWLGLSSVNLDGDAQADLRVHGGPDKAVYAYPSEHLAGWRELLGQPLDEPAPFGENLSTAGATEGEVAIGERWAWGDAVLEVCQPRWPCHKLIIHRGTVEAAEVLVESGRCGWYLRVLAEGRVPVDGPIEVVHRPAGPSVLACMRARTALHDGDPAAAEEVVGAPALADQWRHHLEAGLRSLRRDRAGRDHR